MPRSAGSRLLFALVMGLAMGPSTRAVAQDPPPVPQQHPAQRRLTPPPVERLGDNLLRVGKIRVDTKAREISVAGSVNDVQALEFIANAEKGFKAYESVLSLDTDAISFNLSLLLIGLDRKGAVVPMRHFDPVAPKGDPVEIWVEWETEGKRTRVRAEDLVYNMETKRTLAPNSWVYTGSTFIVNSNAYMADLEGTLIGFVHTPAPVIEHSGELSGPYGANRLNPDLKLTAGTRVTLTVRALPKGEKR
jgi:hypothetical protein